MSQKTVPTGLGVENDLQTGERAVHETIPEYHSRTRNRTMPSERARNGHMDYRAFHEDQGLYLGLFPRGILTDLKDQSSLEKRHAAVNTIQLTIQGCKKKRLLQESLPQLVELVTTPLNDTNFKIVLIGLQLMGDLIEQVGSLLAPYLTPLISSYLGKVGSNKYAVKQAGMHVLIQLMRTLDPWAVTSTVAVYGLTHKQTKVREETLNVIISSLLSFPAKHFKLGRLVEITVPLLLDSKRRVRQACLETLTVLADRMGRRKTKFIMSMIADMEKKLSIELEDDNIGLLLAFQTRLARKELPRLNSDGLVDHLLTAASGHSTQEFTGADVDWILTATKGKSPASRRKNAETGGQGAATCPAPGPLKSAGRRLPWDPEQAAASVRNDQPSSVVPPLNTTYPAAMPPPPPPPPPTLPPTSPPQRESYVDMYKRRAARRLTNGSRQQRERVEAHMSNVTNTWLMNNHPVTSERGATAAAAAATSVHDPLNSEAFGMTWPGTVGFGAAKPSNSTSRQISADPTNLAAALQNPQRNNMPMICDPFTTNPYPATQPAAPKPAAAQPPPTAKPLLAASKSQPAKPIARPKTGKPQSPTQIEQSFLGGNAVDEELDSEYYNIPVEENVLDDSLNSSSNSSSLGPAPRDANGTGTVDILSHIRREAASRKAEKMSAKQSKIAANAEANKTTNGTNTSSLSIVPKNRSSKLNGLSCSPPSQVSPLVTEKKIAANKSPSKHNGHASDAVDNAAPTRRQSTYYDEDEEISPPSKQRSLPPPSAAPTRRQPSYYEDDEEISSSSKQRSLPPAPTHRQPTYYNDDEISPPSKQRNLPPPSAAPTRRQPTYYEDDEEISPSSKQRSLPPAPTRRQPTYYNDDEISPPSKQRSLPPPSAAPTRRQPTYYEDDAPPSKPKKIRPPPSAAPTRQPAYGSDNDCTYHEDEEPKRPNAALTRQATHVSDIDGINYEANEPKKIMPSKLPIKKKMLSASSKASSADPIQGKTATQRKPVNLANSTSAPLNRQGHQYDDNDDGLEILTPVQHPEQELRVALKTLGAGGEDWEHKCFCLVILRRLAAHHRHLLLGQLHNVTMVVEKEVRNLRSQVARGAIACLGDMFSLLGRDMEQVLDLPVKTLLLISSKCNVFFREDAEKALLEMVYNISHSRSLPAIINGGASNANTTVRRNVSMLICVAVEYCSPARLLRSSRDVVEKTLTAVALLLSDADPGARFFARKTVYQFLPVPEFEHQTIRMLSTSHQMKVKDVMDILRTKGLGKPPEQVAKVAHHASNSSASQDPSPPRPRKLPSMPPSVQNSGKKTKRRRSTVVDPPGCLGESSVPYGMFENLRGTDWKERFDGLSMLEEYILSRHAPIGSLLLTRIFDVLNERMMDMNSKVNHLALVTFQHIINSLGEELHPVLARTVKAVSTNFASRDNDIRNSAILAMDTLIEYIDPVILMPPFAAAVQEASIRVLPIMMKKLSDIVVCTYEVKPALVHRATLPVFWKTISTKASPNSDLKYATQCLLQSLYCSMGPDLVASAPPTVVDKLRRMVRAMLTNAGMI